VDRVLDCTGRATRRKGAQAHLDRGAIRVLVSAPPKTLEDCNAVLLPGINLEQFNALSNTVHIREVVGLSPSPPTKINPLSACRRGFRCLDSQTMHSKGSGCQSGGTTAQTRSPITDSLSAGCVSSRAIMDVGEWAGTAEPRTAGLPSERCPGRTQPMPP
jgi:hypothetical protein